MIVDDVRLENDMGDWTLVIVSANGTSAFPVHPEMVDDALAGWRQHMSDGEAVRVEREAAGGISFEAYREAQSRTDADWDQNLAELGDFLRKRERENP